MAIFTGSGVALVTPFNSDFTINYEEFNRLVELQINKNTDAIIVCGTTGEASTLSDEEHRSLISHAVKVVNKRVPVIAGTGSNDTSHGVLLSQYAQNVGADALLCVTPYYNKCTQEGLYQHFKAYSDAVNIPIILYNVPHRTGVSLSVNTIQRLSKLDNIRGIKEASGNIAFALEIQKNTPDDFALYAGNDDIVYPLLSIGAHGLISVLANICPKECHDLVLLYKRGAHSQALELQQKMNTLNHALACDVNPIPIKNLLKASGFNVGPLRLPLCDLQEEDLKNLLDCFNILMGEENLC